MELRTACNRDCPDVCGIIATVEHGRVISLRGEKDHPVTAGTLCPRTRRFLSRQYSGDRLITPLVRDSINEPFREIDFEQALDIAAHKLVSIRDIYGPAAILHYRSGGSLGMLMSLTDLFFERFGPVITKRGDICSGAGEAAQIEDFGICDSSDIFDIENAQHIVLWGKNLLTSSPHMLRLIRRAKERGASVTLIDPVSNPTKRLADYYVQVRPGGDFALVMAVCHILLHQGWLEQEARSWCDGYDEFLAMVTSKDLDEWIRLADVQMEDCVALAHAFALHKPVTVLLGWGLARMSYGGAAVRAIDALAAITGNIGVPGAGVSYYVSRKAAFDLSFLSNASARALSEVSLGREILRAIDPPIRAVWVTAGNPVAMLPESETVREALMTRDFVVVVDSFMTDTARCAHMVLPTVTLLESDDLLGSYGHHYITASKPVVEPPKGVRSDLEIMQGLAARTGLQDILAGSALEWKRRMVRHLEPYGITVDVLEKGAIRNPLAPYVLFEGRRFPTPSGRMRLIKQAPPPPMDDYEYPLYLMALSHPLSQGSQWAVRCPDPLEVKVHPDAASGIRDNEIGLLTSRISSIKVRVRHDPSQRRDVVVAPKGGSLYFGLGINTLIRARMTDMGEGAAFYEERVRLQPL